MATLALATACSPTPSADFAGRYASEDARWTCRFDHPESPSSIVRGIVVDLVIEPLCDDVHALVLPMPPCAAAGMPDGDELVLAMDDCAIDLVHRGSEYTILYSEGEGTAVLDGDALQVDTHVRRRFSPVPSGLPSWWAEPGSCDASLVYRRVE